MPGARPAWSHEADVPRLSRLWSTSHRMAPHIVNGRWSMRQGGVRNVIEAYGRLTGHSMIYGQRAQAKHAMFSRSAA